MINTLPSELLILFDRKVPTLLAPIHQTASQALALYVQHLPDVKYHTDFYHFRQPVQQGLLDAAVQSLELTSTLIFRLVAQLA